MSISDWALQYRYIAPGTSSEPGKWTNRAPYQSGIMDEITKPDTKVVVLMLASQTGKTEVVLNTIFYYMHYDPSPILLLLPTESFAKDFTKYRIEPNIEATPVLKSVFQEGNDPRNTLLMKVFPGGFLSVSSALSPAELSSKPIRILVADEIDRFGIIKQEGDPVALAVRRTVTFWNSKILLTSTPTIDGLSRIQQFYEMTDQRKFFVKCPNCQQEQTLEWKQVKWETGPDDAYYECPFCQSHLSDADLKKMVRHGYWKPTSTGKKGWKGFHLNALYSPWYSLEACVADFLEAKAKPERLRVFVNTVLAETWKEDYAQDYQVEFSFVEQLLRQREAYRSEVTAPVKYLVAGVDVQVDRLEVVVLGFTGNDEYFVIEHQTLFGDPTQPQVWELLTQAILRKRYKHEEGYELPVSAMAVDSSAFTDFVYQYVAEHRAERVFAVKGIAGVPSIIHKVSKVDRNATLIIVGVDAVKDIIYARLNSTEKQFFHFPLHLRKEFFEQLLSEKPITRYSRGHLIRTWKKVKERNEVLDCVVYALALDFLVGKQIQQIPELTVSKNDENQPQPQKPASRIKSREKGSWVYNW